jgi:tetratricopeptide (TPR) repeat protein
MAELLAMAMAYRDWSQRELAEFLGRDAHNLIPPSGIPKVDFVMRLAKALDWPAAAVLDDVCGLGADHHAASDQAAGSDFASLNRAAYQAWVDGAFERSVELALRASRVAQTPDEAAQADLRECVAWTYQGRCQSAIEACHRGLRRVAVSAQIAADLRANMASCYFALAHVHEAEGLAERLLGELDSLEPLPDARWRVGIEAHLLYVRAQCQLHRAESEPLSATRLAVAARSDFTMSAEAWRRTAELLAMPGFLGRAHTCEGGLLVVQAILAERPLSEILEDFVAELDQAIDLRTVPKGDPLESFGWWAVFGASVALRLPSSGQDQYLAVFANKALEIAEHSGNWSLRERAFTIDCLRSRRPSEFGGVVLDGEDVRVLTGAMGRFPAFRPAGWELLRRAGRI